MFQTILVPLDGSPTAERALPYALRLARAAGGQVLLTRVVVPAGDASVQHQVDTARAQAYLAGIAERFGDPTVRVDYAIGHGLAGHGILQTATERQVSCVVMVTHGHTGLTELLVGSVTEEVLAHSHLPVLVVNADLQAPAPERFDPEHARVVVPLDGSDFGLAALFAAEELLLADGTLVLVRVVPSADDLASWPEGDEDTDIAYLEDPQGAFDDVGREYLQGVAADVRARRPTCQVVLDVRAGYAADGIVEAARQHQASVVVMATHGRTGLRRQLIGSVTSAVLRSVDCPLLLVHPARSEAQVSA